MSLFKDLGRRVEKFKRQVEDTADDQADFACGNCGERFFTHHDECPDCGSDDVASIRASK